MLLEGVFNWKQARIGWSPQGFLRKPIWLFQGAQEGLEVKVRLGEEQKARKDLAFVHVLREDDVVFL